MSSSLHWSRPSHCIIPLLRGIPFCIIVFGSSYKRNLNRRGQQQLWQWLARLERASYISDFWSGHRQMIWSIGGQDACKAGRKTRGSVTRSTRLISDSARLDLLETSEMEYSSKVPGNPIFGEIESEDKLGVIFCSNPTKSLTYYHWPCAHVQRETQSFCFSCA